MSRTEGDRSGAIDFRVSARTIYYIVRAKIYISKIYFIFYILMLNARR